MAKKNGIENGNVVVIKKYANRRLYNTATSSYVTLDHLAEMVKEGVDFAVYDAKTGEEITRAVLTQIIVEQEAKGEHLLPISFLRKLIGFYGDSLQGFVPRYLEMSMENFSRQQEQMRDMMGKSMGAALYPFGGQSQANAVEDMVKANMATFQRAMEAFYPGNGRQAEAPSAKAPEGEADEADLESLREQVDALKKQLDRLANKGG